MAVTIEKTVERRPFGDPLLFPVASGETIYKGTIATIYQGYLYNLDSDVVSGGRIACYVKDDTANVDGPAATTANGSISGTYQESSVAAGDKTCRLVHVNGEVPLTFTAIAQADVGKVVYASDNFTCDETQIGGMKIGTLTKYISATSGWVMLNTYYMSDGYQVSRGTITAATTTTGGDCISWANPSGETIMVKNAIIDVTTAATGSATADVGIAANGTTSSATLMDDIDIGAAAIVGTAIQDGGTGGQGFRKCTSSQYVTMTPSATAAGLVGSYEIEWKIWE